MANKKNFLHGVETVPYVFVHSPQTSLRIFCKLPLQ